MMSFYPSWQVHTSPRYPVYITKLMRSKSKVGRRLVPVSCISHYRHYQEKGRPLVSSERMVIIAHPDDVEQIRRRLSPPPQPSGFPL